MGSIFVKNVGESEDSPRRRGRVFEEYLEEEVDRENWIGYRKRGGQSILILARESGLDASTFYPSTRYTHKRSCFLAHRSSGLKWIFVSVPRDTHLEQKT